MACAPSKDSDQPGHPTSLIRVFAVRMKKHWVLSYPLSAQRRLIRLGRCRLGWFPGWPESSWTQRPFCWFCRDAAQLCICITLGITILENKLMVSLTDTLSIFFRLGEEAVLLKKQGQMKPVSSCTCQSESWTVAKCRCIWFQVWRKDQVIWQIKLIWRKKEKISYIAFHQIAPVCLNLIHIYLNPS